jgi:hypothetical protein
MQWWDFFTNASKRLKVCSHAISQLIDDTRRDISDTLELHEDGKRVVLIVSQP